MQQIQDLDTQIENEKLEIQRLHSLMNQASSERIEHLRKRQHMLERSHKTMYFLIIGYVLIFGYLLFAQGSNPGHPLYMMLTLITTICITLLILHRQQIAELQQDLLNSSSVDEICRFSEEKQVRLTRLLNEKHRLQRKA